MLVLRRRVGTSVTFVTNDGDIEVVLAGIDWLGGCALIQILRDKISDPVPLELGVGQVERLHADVTIHLIRLALDVRGGTRAGAAEIGFEAPKAVPIYRSEQMDKMDSLTRSP